MTSKSTWKALEYKVRDAFRQLHDGVERVPLSGSSRAMKGDVSDPDFFIECKYRKDHAIHTLFNDVSEENEEAAAGEKYPLVATQKRGDGTVLVTLRLEDFISYCLDCQEGNEGGSE